MAQVITAAEAVARIPDGATLGVSGLGLCGWAEEAGTAIETSFLDGGHPRDLTLVHGAGIGNALGAGTHHLGHEGLVAKWFGAHTGVAPGMAHLIEENQCQAYCI
jgi:propionate CoA-transferase